MDEQPKAEEVEDLDVTPEEGDEVKGGLNYSKIEFRTGSAMADKPDAPRGGWDGNHNESLVRA
jgi:hypothetical protein